MRLWLWNKVRGFWEQKICGRVRVHCKTETVSRSLLREIAMTTLRMKLGEGDTFRSGAIQRICEPIPRITDDRKLQREFSIHVLEVRFLREKISAKSRAWRRHVQKKAH